MTKVKLFVTDENLNRISAPEAARRVPGCTAGMARHYINKRGAKTIDDIKNIVSEILVKGRTFTREEKKHKTIHGMLTSREIWDMHPCKDIVSFQAICNRLSSHGGMWGLLWEGNLRNRDKNNCFTRKHKKSNVLTVDIGQTVFSGGRKYEVSEFHDMDKEKGHAMGFRIMPSGQVLKNTNHFLGQRWEISQKS